MVQLRDFVAESLQQLIDGIVAAQDYAKSKGADVNPNNLFRVDTQNFIVSPTPVPAVPSVIEFDVAVTASESGGTKAGIGVFAGAFGGSTQASMEDSNITVSRIKFTVPVLFPRQLR